ELDDVNPTDAVLPTVGRVVKNPQDPKKRMVLLERKKYLDCIDRKELFDLNSFVAHEVFETKDKDLSPAYPITKALKFSEKRYQEWLARYVYASESANPLDRFAAVSYSFSSGKYGLSWNWQNPSEAEAVAYKECIGEDCQSLGWVRNG